MKRTLTDIAITVVLAVVAMMMAANLSAQAATPDTDPVPLCTPIAMAGGIMIYRCIPEDGYPFLINNMGFMLAED